MAKLLMCRICLDVDVKMHSIVTIQLQQMYENLSMKPFETQDERPLQACYMCYARLRNCYQLRKSCIQSEELLTEMLNNNMLNQTNLENSMSKKLKIVPVIQICIDDMIQRNAHCNNIKETDQVCCNMKEEPTDNEVAVIKKEPPDETSSEMTQADVEDDVTLGVKRELSLYTNECDSEEPELPTLNKKQEALLESEHAERNIRKIAPENNIISTLSISTLDTMAFGPTTSKGNDGKLKKSEEYVRKIKQYIKSKNTPMADLKILNNEVFLQCQERQRASIPVTSKQYICDTCQKSFLKKYDLSRHVRIHTGEKHLNLHIRTHTRAKYQCDICKRCFNVKSNLIKHIYTHAGEKPYQCDICSKSFRQKSHLNIHIRTHTSEKPNQCDICMKRFRTKTYLNKHILTHTGEKPYQCNICKKCFRTKSHLNIHIRTHTGDKPYQCNICTRCFSIKSNLNKHIRRHAGLKPHQCDKCKKCFSTKYSLNNHIRIHTGVKPYQ